MLKWCGLLLDLCVCVDVLIGNGVLWCVWENYVFDDDCDFGVCVCCCCCEGDVNGVWGLRLSGGVVMCDGLMWWCDGV